jgi:hypothetical protein
MVTETKTFNRLNLEFYMVLGNLNKRMRTDTKYGSLDQTAAKFTSFFFY